MRFTVCLCVCLGLLQFTGQRERLCKQHPQSVCVFVHVCVCAFERKMCVTGRQFLNLNVIPLRCKINIHIYI